MTNVTTQRTRPSVASRRLLSTEVAHVSCVWPSANIRTCFVAPATTNRAQIENMGCTTFCTNQRYIAAVFAQRNAVWQIDEWQFGFKAIQYVYINGEQHHYTYKCTHLTQENRIFRSRLPRAAYRKHGIPEMGYIWGYWYCHPFGECFGHFCPTIFPVAGGVANRDGSLIGYLPYGKMKRINSAANGTQWGANGWPTSWSGYNF